MAKELSASQDEGGKESNDLTKTFRFHTPTCAQRTCGGRASCRHVDCSFKDVISTADVT